MVVPGSVLPTLQLSEEDFERDGIRQMLQVLSVLARHYNNRNNSSSNSNGMSVRENIVDILQSAALIAREDQNDGQHEANHISEDVAVGEEIDNSIIDSAQQ